MHNDLSDLFSIGDTRSWDVELVDGRTAGWPDHVLADVTVTIRSRPRWAIDGTIADTGVIKACWRGSEPPGTVLPLHAGLVADVWNPMFRANVTGVIQRIRTVAYRYTEREGSLWPTGPWVLEDIDRTPRCLGTAKPRADPNDVFVDGLLINLAITHNEIHRWD
jgi:hypothetical protein